MNKQIKYLIMSAMIFANANINAKTKAGDLLPYDNLGLNYLTSAVVDVQNDVDNMTGFRPFFDYYGVFLQM